MAGVQGSGNWPRLLELGVEETFGDKYESLEDMNKYMFNTKTIQKDTITDVQWEKYAFAQARAPGTPSKTDSRAQGIVPRYKMITYALQMAITKEALRENLYWDQGMDRAEDLAESMHQTQQLIGAGVFNDGFDTTVTMPGGDGQPLYSTAHPSGVANSATYSNRLATDAAFSESSLEQMLIDIHSQNDPRGLEAGITAESLLGPPALEFEFGRVLNSAYTPDTANNAINVIVKRGLLKGGTYYINRFFTSSTAWFVKNDLRSGMKRFISWAVEFDRDRDFSTSNLLFSSNYRESYGWSDARGSHGTTGT